MTEKYIPPNQMFIPTYFQQYNKKSIISIRKSHWWSRKLSPFHIENMGFQALKTNWYDIPDSRLEGGTKNKYLFVLDFTNKKLNLTLIIKFTINHISVS